MWPSLCTLASLVNLANIDVMLTSSNETLTKYAARPKPCMLHCEISRYVASGAEVLISRVTDPANLQLVGVPPRDLLQEVEQAWRELGYDVHECWQRAVSVTGEWQYHRGGACIQDRIVQKRLEERRIPLKHRTMQEVLDPMPRASEVIQKLLSWI